MADRVAVICQPGAVSAVAESLARAVPPDVSVVVVDTLSQIAPPDLVAELIRRGTATFIRPARPFDA